jgi:hypothetical protein
VHDVHLIFTIDEDGFTTVTSPQIPELIGGWTSPQEAAPAVDELLAFVGVPTTAHVEWHEQKYVVSPSGLEYLVRFSVESPPNAERESSAGKALAAIENGDIEADKDRQPTTATGERIIIAVSGQDTMGWVLDQIGDDQSVTIQSNPHGDYCYSAPILGADKDIGRGKGDELEVLGLSRESTIVETMDKLITKEAATLRETPSAKPDVAVHKDLTHA